MKNNNLPGRNLARDPLQGWDFQCTYTLALAVSLFLLKSTEVSEIPELRICGARAFAPRLLLEKGTDLVLEWKSSSGVSRQIFIECKYRQDGLSQVDFLKTIDQLLLHEFTPHTDLLVVSNHACFGLRRRFRLSRLPGDDQAALDNLSSDLNLRDNRLGKKTTLPSRLATCYWNLGHRALDSFLIRALGIALPARTGLEIDCICNDLKTRIRNAMKADAPSARLLDADVFMRWMNSLVSLRVDQKVLIKQSQRCSPWFSREIQYQQKLSGAILLIWQRRYRAGLLDLKELGTLARHEFMRATTPPKAIEYNINALIKIDLLDLPEEAHRRIALTALDQLVSVLTWLFTEGIPNSDDFPVTYNRRFDQFESLAAQILSPDSTSSIDVALVDAWRQTLGISQQDYRDTVERIRQIHDNAVFTCSMNYDQDNLISNLEKLMPLIEAEDWPSLQRALAVNLVRLPHTLSHFLNLIAARMIRVGDLVLQRCYAEAADLLASTARGLEQSDLKNEDFRRLIQKVITAKREMYSRITGEG